MNNIKSRLNTRGLQQQIRLRNTTERDVLVIAVNQFAGHGLAISFFILIFNNYIDVGSESIYKRIECGFFEEMLQYLPKQCP